MADKMSSFAKRLKELQGEGENYSALGQILSKSSPASAELITQSSMDNIQGQANSIIDKMRAEIERRQKEAMAQAQKAQEQAASQAVKAQQSQASQQLQQSEQAVKDSASQISDVRQKYNERFTPITAEYNKTYVTPESSQAAAQEVANRIAINNAIATQARAGKDVSGAQSDFQTRANIWADDFKRGNNPIVPSGTDIMLDSNGERAYVDKSKLPANIKTPEPSPLMRELYPDFYAKQQQGLPHPTDPSKITDVAPQAPNPLTGGANPVQMPSLPDTVRSPQPTIQPSGALPEAVAPQSGTNTPPSYTTGRYGPPHRDDEQSRLPASAGLTPNETPRGVGYSDMAGIPAQADNGGFLPSEQNPNIDFLTDKASQVGPYPKGYGGELPMSQFRTSAAIQDQLGFGKPVSTVDDLIANGTAKPEDRDFWEAYMQIGKNKGQQQKILGSDSEWAKTPGGGWTNGTEYRQDMMTEPGITPPVNNDISSDTVLGAGSNYFNALQGKSKANEEEQHHIANAIVALAKGDPSAEWVKPALEQVAKMSGATDTADWIRRYSAGEDVELGTNLDSDLLRQGIKPVVSLPDRLKTDLRGITPNQLNEGNVSRDVALALCGPAAIVAATRAFGHAPQNQNELQWAMNLAAKNGWTPGTGMAGAQSEINTLRDVGIQAEMGGLDKNRILQSLDQGVPVILNFGSAGAGRPGHYFVIEGYNEQNGKFDFGNSAKVLTSSRGNSEYSLEEIVKNPIGVFTGAIYMQGNKPAVAASNLTNRQKNVMSTPVQERKGNAQPTIQEAAASAPKGGYNVYNYNGPVDVRNHSSRNGTQEGEIEDFVRRAAQARGIDDDFAIQIVDWEGGRSNPVKQNNGGSQAYGPLQMMKGGLGTEFERYMRNTYGVDADVRDPRYWKAATEFGLDTAAKARHWIPWEAATKRGIEYKGFKNPRSIGISDEALAYAGIKR